MDPHLWAMSSPSPSHIPRFTSTSSLRLGPSPYQQLRDAKQAAQDGADWKSRLDDCERRRRMAVADSQRSAREYASLEKKYQQMQNTLNNLQKQLVEKDEKYSKLVLVSEQVFNEYEKLKSKYEVETEAMQGAMKTATQWYKQNRELKRKSAVLVQKFLEVSPDSGIDLVDGEDDMTVAEKDEDDLAQLRETVKELGGQVAELQGQLKVARLQEFEAQEAAAELSSLLEAESERRRRLEAELDEAQRLREQTEALACREAEALRQEAERKHEEAQRARQTADSAQKERNVLAHQSALLLAEVVGEERVMQLLQEVDSLKRQLEDEQRSHAAQLQELQERLEQHAAEAQLELLEERLKLSEAELQCALQRAERAESSTVELTSKVERLVDEVESLKRPPPPPPPPPPPIPPPLPQQCAQPAQSASLGKVSPPSDRDPVGDMASMLGLPRHAGGPKGAPSVAISEIVNQIKGGRFTLKSPEKAPSKKEEEPPPAVQEMLTIIGTLKRRKKPQDSNGHTQQAPADIAL